MPRNYLSYTMALILHALDSGYRYGFDIMAVTGLSSGTVYPALRRLEDADLLVSKWEKHQLAQQEQRPPRKYYEVTASGRAVLAEARARFRFLQPIEPEPRTSLATDTHLRNR
jgi:DNA-binding PadR family transcriptional regulator